MKDVEEFVRVGRPRGTTGGNGDSGLLRIVRGASINLGGWVSSQLLGLLYVFLLARLLTTHQMGLYYLGVTIVTFANSISMAGTDAGVRRFISIHHGAADVRGMSRTLVSAFMIVVPLSIVTALVLFAFSRGIAAIMSKPELAHVLAGLSFSLPFFAAASICWAATHGMKYMQYKVYCEDIFNVLFKILILSLLYLLGLRLFSAVLAYGFSIALVSAISFYFLIQTFPWKYSGTLPRENLKEFLNFSLPQMLSSSVYQVRSLLDNVMLGYFTLASSIGIYAVAFKVVAAGTCVLGAFNTMFSPIIADLHHQGEMGQLERLYKTITKWVLTLSLPIYFFFIFFATEILQVFGPEFGLGSQCIVLLAVANIINAGTGPAGIIVLMSGYSHITLLNNILAVGIHLALSILLIPQYGIIGAAVAASASGIVLNVVRVIEVAYLLKMQPYKPATLKPVLAGLASVTIPVLASNYVTIESGLRRLGFFFTAFIVIYAAFLALLKLDDDDRVVLGRARQLITAYR